MKPSLYEMKVFKVSFFSAGLTWGCCCSVTKSCPSLCNPMDCSTLGFLVLHCLPEFAQTHPLSWWCHPTISSSYRWIPCCVVLICFSQAWLFMTPWPGSSIHWISPARILEGVTMSFSRGSSWPRDQTLPLLSLLALHVDSLLLSLSGSPGEP